MPGFSKPRLVDSDGVRLAVYEEGEGVPVVMCHGWPDLAASWANQMTGLAAAGFHAIAADGRGYGASDRPDAIEAYDIHHLTDDIVAILDGLGLEKAVLAGHDWGGIVVWHAAMLHKDRIAGVIGVNTPHLAYPPKNPTEIFIAAAGPDHYWAQHQTPGVAEAAYEADIEKFVQYFFRRPGHSAAENDLPPSAYHFVKNIPKFEGAPVEDMVMPPEAYAHHVKTFQETGLTGGINWYRNSKRNWELMAGVDHHLDLPCLMITADCDAFSKPAFASGMKDLCSDLEMHMIKGAGHWTMWEKPEELNALMIDWLNRRFGEGL